MRDYKRPRVKYIAPFMPLESSTRVRVLKIISYLKRVNEIADLAQYGDKLDKCNIIVIQKHHGSQWVEFIKEMQKEGVIVVYDIVDKLGRGVKNILEIVDAVIVDCQAMKDYCCSLTDKKLDITTIPDCPDYIDKQFSIPIHSKEDNLDIVFFASPSNLDCIEVCKEALIRLKKKRSFSFAYISGQPQPDYFVGLDAQYIKWDSCSFTTQLRKFDLVVLPQKFEKGDAKLVQAITHNIPTISSDIMSYRQIAEKTGTAEFLCKTTDDWLNTLIEMFNPATRNIFLKRTVDLVWSLYNPSRIVSSHRKLFTHLLIQKRGGKIYDYDYWYGRNWKEKTE